MNRQGVLQQDPELLERTQNAVLAIPTRHSSPSTVVYAMSIAIKMDDSIGGVHNGFSVVCVSFLVVHDIEFAEISTAEFVPGFQLGCS